MASMPNATMPECDNPGLAAGRLRTAPRPGYAPSATDLPIMLEFSKPSTFRGIVVVALAFFTGEDFFGDESGILADGGFDFPGDVRIVFQESLGVLAALADALAVVGVPGAGFFDDAGCAEIDQFALLRDAFAIEDVELDLRRAAPSCSSPPLRGCGCRRLSRSLIAPIRRISRRTEE